MPARTRRRTRRHRRPFIISLYQTNPSKAPSTAPSAVPPSADAQKTLCFSLSVASSCVAGGSSRYDAAVATLAAGCMAGSQDLPRLFSPGSPTDPAAVRSSTSNKLRGLPSSALPATLITPTTVLRCKSFKNIPECRDANSSLRMALSLRFKSSTVALVCSVR